MASRYLGSEIVPVSETPFAAFSPSDWAIEYIGQYGQIDGDHHSKWVTDQVARILLGTPITVNLAKWDNGTPEGLHEYRFNTGEPSEKYLQWVEEMKDGGEYEYDEGIAP